MIQWLFDVSNFPKRADCCVNQPWSDGFALWYAAGGVSIALAYYANPLLLLYAYRKHKLASVFGRHARLFVWYAIFIAACGTGHLLENVMTFWYPNYRLISVWNHLTGLVSWQANVLLYTVLVALGVRIKTLEQDAAKRKA